MKTAKYFLPFTTAILFFCASAFAAMELHDAGEKPLLIAKSDPVLAGIEPLCVVIVHSDTELNKSDLLWKNLQKKVEGELKKAGVEVIAIPDNNYPSEIPELRISVDLFRHENSNRFFMRIRTSLARLVYIEKSGSVSVKTDVWQIGPAMDLSSLENLQTVITRHVSKQVDVFINACLAASHTPKSSDANNMAVTRRNVPGGKSVPDKYPYVASKNGKVFHKASCVWASKIKPENLVGYSTRDEALTTGKRPCTQCKP